MLVFTAELTKGKVPIRCSRPLEACTFSCRIVEFPTCRLPELWNTCRSNHEVHVASNLESQWGSCREACLLSMQAVEKNAEQCEQQTLLVLAAKLLILEPFVKDRL